ncbi:MAG: HPr kinase/phosphorylase [Phenylobacterium sp.]|uniref:HPr kinase/phosphorylase n=1 Tax=Phenylobacterium sp. TaxID=1871053 RepID=UPI0027250679|nr:HPr kinase/phosphorylase [Phenylobacterium sp.]MDO8900511.1 HPr kinase/phosphorylase [Phenylobacterium sp.]MDP2214524.1 HPr kinase/phosphorylase [Phenylobacterium sp.]
MILHAGLIARHGPGGWRGVLIEGPSGAGKSDLALRCLGAGFRLVADDRVITWTSAGRLFGRAPDSLAERLEIRGLGVGRVSALPLAPLSLWVRLGSPERSPDLETVTHLGVETPLFVLAPLENSAPAKLSHALDSLG